MAEAARAERERLQMEEDERAFAEAKAMAEAARAEREREQLRAAMMMFGRRAVDATSPAQDTESSRNEVDESQHMPTDAITPPDNVALHVPSSDDDSDVSYTTPSHEDGDKKHGDVDDDDVADAIHDNTQVADENLMVVDPDETNSSFYSLSEASSVFFPEDAANFHDDALVLDDLSVQEIESLPDTIDRLQHLRRMG